MINLLTETEMKLMKIAMTYDSAESQLDDNFSELGFDDIHKLGYSRHEAAGIVGALCKKGFAYTDDEDEVKSRFMGQPRYTRLTPKKKKEFIVDNTVIWPTEEGIKVYFKQLEGGE